MPGIAEWRTNLARLLAALGEESEAENHAKAAVVSDPTIAPAHELWGALALNRGDFDTAIRELQTALKLNPPFPKAEYELGLALYSKGDTQPPSRTSSKPQN